MTILLTKVMGIGPATAEILQKHGVTSAENLAAATVAEISAIPGFSEIRATRAIAAANQAMTESVEVSDTEPKAKKVSKDKSSKNKAADKKADKKEDEQKDAKKKKKKDSKKDSKKKSKKEESKVKDTKKKKGKKKGSGKKGSKKK